MSEYIIKLTDKTTKTDYYLVWSTVVDAPITNGKSLDEFKKWYEIEYGRKSISELPERLERVEKTGTSMLPQFGTLSSLLLLNAAGENGKKISRKKILEKYCTCNV